VKEFEFFDVLWRVSQAHRDTHFAVSKSSVAQKMSELGQKNGFCQFGI